LYQVEYAMEAITHAGAAIGILSTEGIVFCAEKPVTSKLLDMNEESEKMYQIDDHVCCVVAGITSDANILINNARLTSQRYLYTYGENIPVEQLVRGLCDTKQSVTQYGGLRPFGVSLLYGGWDEHYGYQLYKSDPSGNYGGWSAIAIGSNNQAARSILKQEYKENPTLEQALELAVKVLNKTMDSTSLNSEKIEFATLTRNDKGKIKFKILSTTEVDKLLEKYKILVNDD